MAAKLQLNYYYYYYYYYCYYYYGQGVKIQLCMSKIVSQSRHFPQGKFHGDTKQINLFFFGKKKIKNKVAVSTTKHQKSAFFSLQYIYNDLPKSTEILSVSSFCFYRLFPIQKYICNQRLLFTGK